jgi:DNA-binding response OmpR family regulator
MSEPRKKVLVVDDDDDLRDLACLHLGTEYATVPAGDGTTAKALAETEAPDAIVLDMMMPGLSGVPMLRALQAQAKTKDIPVIVVTAFNYSDAEFAAIEKEPNVRTLMRKPFSFEKLRQNVAAILAARRALKGGPAVAETPASTDARG